MAPLATVTCTPGAYVVFSISVCGVNSHVIIYYICNWLSYSCFGNHGLFPIENKPLLAILVCDEVTFTG